jgi:hypothetical protein
MRVATLISWLLTVSLGGFMLHTWLDRGGMRQARESPDGLPPALIFGHAVLATVGLLLWAAYLVTGVRPVAWAAVGALMVTVGLGLCTVTLWTPYPARRPGERRSAPDAELRSGAAAEPANPAAEDDPYQVTDEMITRLLAGTLPGRPSRQIRPNPAVLVPIAHGFAAIGTFVLAVMSAIM